MDRTSLKVFYVVVVVVRMDSTEVIRGNGWEKPYGFWNEERDRSIDCFMIADVEA